MENRNSSPVRPVQSKYNITVIGLLGYTKSGKTTLAKQLEEHLGFVRINSADPLKAMLAAGFGLTEKELDGDLRDKPCEELMGATPRYALQTLGKDWLRLINPELLAFTCKNKIIDLYEDEGYSRFVVENCRFQKDVEAVHSFPNGKVIRLIGKTPELISEYEDEISQIKDLDYAIQNDYSTPANLLEIVLNILPRLKEFL